MRKLVLLAWLALASLSCFAQNGNNYARGFVYIGALASIPSTCSVGTISFITDATAGQNIYECASANTWTQQSGGGSGSPGGSSATVQWNSGGSFAGLSGSASDNCTDVSGTTCTSGSHSSTPYSITRTYTLGDLTNTIHAYEAAITLQGATKENTFASFYGTQIFNGSGGCGHCINVVSRMQHHGQGTIDDWNMFYADMTDNNTATGTVSESSHYYALAGSTMAGAETYSNHAGFRYDKQGWGTATATVEQGVAVGMPTTNAGNPATFYGVRIGGAIKSGKYTAFAMDGGEAYLAQGIEQTLILDNTVNANLTTGGNTTGGVTSPFYQSIFASGSFEAANWNSLLTLPNGATGTYRGARVIVDNGGSGLAALINPFYGKCSNSGGATTTECDGLIVDTPVNSGATLTTTRGVYIKSQASGTQTGTPIAIETAGAADLVKFAGPVTTNGGVGLALTSQTTITAGAAVKVDTANNNSVVLCATSDTTGCSGFAQNAATAGQTVYVLTGGNIATPILGTGTCTKGQFVIPDTTTAGRVKCTGTYTAGTVLGWVTTAQASVGSAVGVQIQIR